MVVALRALRHRRFAALWLGQTLSRVGDFIYEIVIAWWVLQETGSAAVMSTVLIVTFLPVAVFTLVGGVVVDRAPKAWLMLASDLLRALAVLGVAFLATADQMALWWIYGLGLLFGVADAFFTPAYFALVPELVPEEDLNSANALTSLSFQLGRVLGPALGGVIVAAGGAALGLFINGASFVVAALCLLPLLAVSKVPARDPQASQAHWLADLREGLATVRAQPFLRLALGLGALAGAFLVGPFLVSMPFLITERFGEDARIYGLLLACFPAGFVLGGLWGGRQERLPQRGRVIFGGLAVGGLALGLFGLPAVPAWGLMALAVLNGFALQVNGLAWVGLVQERVPAEQLGRVSSLEQLLSWTLTPVAFALTGWLVGRWGPAFTFWLGGFGALALALAGLLHPATQEVD